MNENFHISREEIKELFNAMRTIQWEEDSGNFELRYSGTYYVFCRFYVMDF